MKKKITVFALVACLLVVAGFAAGCGGKGSDPLADGTLTIGTNATYTPYEYKDDNNKTVGFDIDFGNAIAKKLGVKAQWKDVDFDAIFNGVNSGQYDIGMACISLTKERQKNFAMTKPYIGNGIVIVSRTGDNEATNVDQLKGKKVGVQNGTTADSAAQDLNKKQKLGMQLKKYDSMVDAFTSLEAHNIDYIMTDKGVGDYYTAKKPTVYKVSSKALSNEPVAICCRSANKDLAKKIDKAISDLKKDGTYGKLTKKWFGEDLTDQKIDTNLKSLI